MGPLRQHPASYRTDSRAPFLLVRLSVEVPVKHETEAKKALQKRDRPGGQIVNRLLTDDHIKTTPENSPRASQPRGALSYKGPQDIPQLNDISNRGL
jgi:hypothetical protein